MTLEEFIMDWQSANPFLKVHTSGSTGIPKEMLVEKKRMEASARMTCDFLGLKEGDSALLCMPLDYIAGKMMVVRSLVRKLRLISVEPSSTPLDEVNESLDFVAMVPFQVIRSLDNPKLKKIKNLIIGGGSISPELEAVLRDFPNNVYSTYGMTETLSHVALRRISGPSSSLWYTPMDGVSVKLDENGCLLINAPHVCAYTLYTNDIAEINANGDFCILGRLDNVINSGGVKIQIESVERAISTLAPNIPFLITSAPDDLLGETVVALVPKAVDDTSFDVLTSAMLSLHKYWQPRRVVRVSELPMTGTGKPDRKRAKEIAEGTSLV